MSPVQRQREPVQRQREPVYEDAESSFIQGARPRREPIYLPVDTNNRDDESDNHYDELNVSYIHSICKHVRLEQLATCTLLDTDLYQSYVDPLQPILAIEVSRKVVVIKGV